VLVGEGMFLVGEEADDLGLLFMKSTARAHLRSSVRLVSVARAQVPAP